VSRSNLAIVRSIVDAANRGALDEVAAFYDPHIDIVLRGPDDWLDAGAYVGREQVMTFLGEWFETFEGLGADIEEELEQDDRALVCLRTHGRGRSSDVEVEMRRWWAYWFRAGVVARIEIYADRDEAITAAGISPTSRPTSL
jgi:ketosteroid isomerase-like protein